MKHLKSINHIGYAVKDIESTAQLYKSAGWMLTPIVEEPSQNAKIAFLKKEGFPTIELVSALQDCASPVAQILKKNGVSPYHICYDCEDITVAVEDLFEEGFRPLFMPQPSVAMHGAKICYLYKSEIGLIELVETLPN